MSCNNMGCLGGSSERERLIRHMMRFIGEVVTIFTTSGGVSGCGFTGTLLSVNCDFVRLVTQPGSAPSNPLSESICGEMEEDGCNGIGGGIGGKVGNVGGIGSMGHKHRNECKFGSVCDIPINKIAAFCHNSV